MLPSQNNCTTYYNE
uniref:Uncharacterized protein n=1 Tax=Arundo donax TaxID=35708 RepID=A0A0A9FUT1_ARUDO